MTWRAAVIAGGVLFGCATSRPIPTAPVEPGTMCTSGRIADKATARRCIGWVVDRALVSWLGEYDDPALARYVAWVGARIAEHTDARHVRWTFRVLDSAGIEAYAVTGGYVYISRGALAQLGSEAELAALLGHEIAHVAAGHGDQLWEDIDSDADREQTFLHFARERDEERQADELAVRYLARAGYAPGAMLQMLEAVHRESEGDDDDDGDGRGIAWDRTHPPRAARLARAALVIGAQRRGDGALERERFLRAIEGLLTADGKAGARKQRRKR